MRCSTLRVTARLAVLPNTGLPLVGNVVIRCYCHSAACSLPTRMACSTTCCHRVSKMLGCSSQLRASHAQFARPSPSVIESLCTPLTVTCTSCGRKSRHCRISCFVKTYLCAFRALHTHQSHALCMMHPQTHASLGTVWRLQRWTQMTSSRPPVMAAGLRAQRDAHLHGSSVR